MSTKVLAETGHHSPGSERGSPQATWSMSRLLPSRAAPRGAGTHVSASRLRMRPRPAWRIWPAGSRPATRAALPPPRPPRPDRPPGMVADPQPHQEAGQCGRAPVVLGAGTPRPATALPGQGRSRPRTPRLGCSQSPLLARVGKGQGRRASQERPGGWTKVAPSRRQRPTELEYEQEHEHRGRGPRRRLRERHLEGNAAQGQQGEQLGPEQGGLFAWGMSHPQAGKAAAASSAESRG